MQQAMERVWHDAVALRQKAVGAAEHHAVTLYSLGARAKEIRQPPRLQLADEQNSVADPQPVEQPVRVRMADRQSAEDEAHRERRSLNQCNPQQTAGTVQIVDGFYVVERRYRHPVMQPKKDYLEGLQRQECIRSPHLFAVVSRYVLRPLALGKRDAGLHRRVEIRMHRLDRDVTPEEIGPDELGERGRRFVVAALIAYVPGQRAIHIVDQLAQFVGQQRVVVACAVLIERVHPEVLVHLLPESLEAGLG